MQVEDLQQHVETQFLNLAGADLRAACNLLSIKIGGNEGDASMRAKLCNAMGAAAPVAPVTKVNKAAESFAKMPQLGPDGIWEGQWWYITVQARNDKLTSCPVAWQGNYRNLPLNEEVKVIAPHYFALRDAIGEKIGQRSYRDDNGIQHFEKVSSPFSEFIIGMARVDPETAHLPTSYIDHFRKIEARKPKFVGLNRNQLIFIAEKLECTYRDDKVLRVMNRRDFAAMDDEAIRVLICEKMVPGFGADIFEDVEAA